MYYRDDKLVADIKRAMPLLIQALPSVHLVLIEMDHVHVETTRRPDGPVTLDVVSYDPGRMHDLCPTAAGRDIGLEKIVKRYTFKDTSMDPRGYNPLAPRPVEEAGLDEYEEGEYEDGEYEDGEYEEDGDYEEDGEYEDEAGGIADSVDEFIEHGAKRKKRKRKGRFLRFAPRKKKKGRKAKRRSCPEIGYGSGLLASPGVPLRDGFPYVAVKGNVRVISPPIEMSRRIPRQFLQTALMLTALRTSEDPPFATQVSGGGGFVGNVDVVPPVGRQVEVMGVVIDVGPTVNNTPVNSQLTIRPSGQYVDGEATNMGLFRFLLPTVMEGTRIILLSYKMHNGAPYAKMMRAANTFLAPGVPALVPQNADSAGDDEQPVNLAAAAISQPFRLEVNLPQNINFTATLLTPANPEFEHLAQLMGCACR